MTAVSNTPINNNFLSPLNFNFNIKRAPHVNFFIQKAEIPGLSLVVTQQPNPFVRIPVSGEHLMYDNLDILFKVDEDLQNYMEIHSWLEALGFPDNYNQYANLAAQDSVTGGGLQSELLLTILTSAKNPNYKVTFKDAFPISLGKLEFDTSADDVIFMSASVTFKYTYFTIEKI